MKKPYRNEELLEKETTNRINHKAHQRNLHLSRHQQKKEVAQQKARNDGNLPSTKLISTIQLLKTAKLRWEWQS